MAEPREIPILTIARQAEGADIAEGVIVKFGTVAKAMVVATGSNDILMGINQKITLEDDFGDVRILGVAKVLGGATVTEGTKLKSDGNGKAIAVTTDFDTVIGITLEPMALDVISEVLLSAPGMQHNV